MVPLKQNSELITRQVAAGSILSSSLFVTVRDERHRADDAAAGHGERRLARQAARRARHRGERRDGRLQDLRHRQGRQGESHPAEFTLEGEQGWIDDYVGGQLVVGDRTARKSRQTPKKS